jgi:hypothetical protein
MKIKTSIGLVLVVICVLLIVAGVIILYFNWRYNPRLFTISVNPHLYYYGLYLLFGGFVCSVASVPFLVSSPERAVLGGIGMIFLWFVTVLAFQLATDYAYIL